MAPELLGVASAFGLASAAGLNTTLPLLIVGALHRVGLLTLAAPFDALGSDVALAGLLALGLLEIAADKVPGVDSLVQTVQWPLTMAAGAILFASQQSVVTDVSPGLAVLVGVVTAGGVHALRTAVRPVVTAATAGLGNSAVSLVEDATSVLLVALALLAPLLAVLAVVALAVLGVLLARRVGGWIHARARGAPLSGRSA
jgi:hypothetical protein